MKYIGSKQKLLDFIEEMIEKVAGKEERRVFADSFFRYRSSCWKISWKEL